MTAETREFLPLGGRAKAHPSLGSLLVPIDKVRPHPANPRNGDVDTIRESIEVNHLYRPLYVQYATGYILAGNHTYAALMELGAEHVPVIVLDVSDEEASRILLVDNKAADLGGYDYGLLVDILHQLEVSEQALLGTGYVEDDLRHLELLANETLAGLEQAAEVEAGRGKAKQHRQIDLRMIFSVSAGPSHVEAQIARRIGWGIGVLSEHYRSVLKHRERFERMPKDIAFMDNPYRDYDHVAHVNAVMAVQPTSCTTRDLFTKQQCVDEGLEYFSLEQTIEQASDLAPYVDDLILIPKYDCLDDIPETISGKRVVLGYSVPTSYGGTPMPISAFKGRPIHLLGGPWGKQRSYLNLMGDDIIGLDNNHCLYVSQMGQVCKGDGTMVDLKEYVGIEQPFTVYLPALTLSLTEIASAVYAEFGSDLREFDTTAVLGLPEPEITPTH